MSRTCFDALPDDSFGIETRSSVECLSLSRAVSDWHVAFHYYVSFVMSVTSIHSFISIQPWRPGLAGTRAQSCDRYGSGTLHPGQVLGAGLPLFSPAFRRSHFSRQVPPSKDARDPSSERWNCGLNSDFVNLGIYDMGQTALLPLRRKACWGFVRPKNLGYLRPARYP